MQGLETLTPALADTDCCDEQARKRHQAAPQNREERHPHNAERKDTPTMLRGYNMYCNDNREENKTPSQNDVAKELETHHRSYERLGYEELSDLTVCKACHSRHHGKEAQL